MRPTFADFSVQPAQLANATVEYRRCMFDQNHLSLDAAGAVALTFMVDGDEEIVEATLKVTALVSKLGPSSRTRPAVTSNGTWRNYARS
ncbi:hypothetical protein ACFQ07_23395 [Actinomadura adrarensis]|uniref:Uncharacterized protein n=1 Tax=Actinomadura adrarensis TaxID=1819600 RepID=A0ABW3CMI6_9ACTN